MQTRASLGSFCFSSIAALHTNKCIFTPLCRTSTLAVVLSFVSRALRRPIASVDSANGATAKVVSLNLVEGAVCVWGSRLRQ